ncbi:MAG: HypC/HybG/HupF family hydrogenase formation chaperone [Calditrichaceae bacterium]|nr:HypC/HybG/HupF family hydrogenase formation chaperone [Calditrichaceae bacterium]MBN2709899.1 HypC/HybG/HupF family hydrogenase formation chaperone [Calditrichaceae bacterium]RQV92655.1 MAG: HypC/HybG/HupF family hydrogenase formation chaperone [Calditrichota bacterium]
MCLAIPGKVIEIFEENNLKMGKIDYNGVINKACLAYVPEVVTGQYVIVHAGFAISMLDEEEAQRSFEAWDDFADRIREEGYEVTSAPLSDKKRKESDK